MLDDAHLMPVTQTHAETSQSMQSPYRQSPRQTPPSGRGRPETPRGFDKKMLLAQSQQERDPHLDAPAVRPASSPPAGPSTFAQAYSEAMGAPAPSTAILPEPAPANVTTTAVTDDGAVEDVVIDLEPSAPPATSQHDIASTHGSESSSGVSLHRDYLDFVNHTNERIQILQNQISNLTKDQQSLEATSLQLMATAHRHDGRINDLNTKTDFLVMNDSHYKDPASERLAKLDEEGSHGSGA